MPHDQVVSFLLALAVLLGTAALLGKLVQRLGVPSVVGDLCAGILLGKTIFGHVAPDAYVWLFARPEAASMLNGYKSVAIVLLLLLAGLEINILSLRRIAGVLIYTSVLGSAVPFICGYGLGLALPDSYLVSVEHRQVFAVFLGIALSISALPVITRTLMDLGLLKTKIGTVVLSAAVVNDLTGWLCFGALVRAMESSGAAGSGTVLTSLLITATCLVVALVVVRPLAVGWLGRLTNRDPLAPRRLGDDARRAGVSRRGGGGAARLQRSGCRGGAWPQRSGGPSGGRSGGPSDRPSDRRSGGPSGRPSDRRRARGLPRAHGRRARRRAAAARAARSRPRVPAPP